MTPEPSLVSGLVGALRALGNGALDLVYPPKCVVCGDIQSLYMCDNCLRAISYLEPPLCGRCGLPLEDKQCQECRRTRFAFAGARAVGVYEGPLREAVHQLKYAGRTVIAPELGRLLLNLMASCPNFAPGVSLVIPIPIHPSRRRERGFNQSELLAQPVADYLGVPLVTGALQRSVHSRPQVELPVDARLENVSGAFEVIVPSRVAGGVVLLIDDVLTTGSTANEAARALKVAGASAVYVLTLARSC